MPNPLVFGFVGIVVFVLGGIFAVLLKFHVGIEAIGAFLLLAFIVSVILIALRSFVAWIAIYAAVLFAGMALFTVAYLA